ncbi:hypothetical protein A9Q83_08415 [Alphaproteobacteria bacterium 46_93_T64]|nr:hypothetical protein A9Q83_08415 [Alphaproteobacteria bacterium 46_93_T64]
MKINRFAHFFLILVPLFLFAHIAKSEQSTLTFSHINGSPVHARGAIVLREIYHRLGIDVNFKMAPGRRALKMSNEGKTDGEVFRIWDVGLKYHNLYRVPTPFLTLHGYAFSMKPPTINSFKELSRGHRIGIQRGIIWAENELAGRKGIVHVDTVSDLVDKLIGGSIDVAFATEDGVDAEFRKRNIDQTILHGAPVASFKVYHYLHKKHELLIDKVDRELIKMTKKNEIEKLSNFPFHAMN